MVGVEWAAWTWAMPPKPTIHLVFGATDKHAISRCSAGHSRWWLIGCRMQWRQLQPSSCCSRSRTHSKFYSCTLSSSCFSYCCWPASCRCSLCCCCCSPSFYSSCLYCSCCSCSCSQLGSLLHLLRLHLLLLPAACSPPPNRPTCRHICLY